MSEFCTYGAAGTTYGGAGTVYGVCEGLHNVQRYSQLDEDGIPSTTGTPYDPDCADEKVC